jgi:hypothetical protein
MNGMAMQIGNAVPALLAERFGNQFIKHAIASLANPMAAG